jgi:hypothetical protein
MTPSRDLRNLGENRYTTTGHDPQFLLHFPARRLRHGLALVTIDLHDAQQPLKPVLYAFSGEPPQSSEFKLPQATHGTIRKLIVLPRQVQFLRLDPTDVRGVDFSVTKVSVHNVGKISCICRAFLVLGWPGRRRLMSAARRLDTITAKKIVFDALNTEDQPEYPAWVRLYDTLTEADCNAIHAQIANMRWRPLISVVMPVYKPRPDYLRSALDSVIRQLYSDWELCIADDASNDPQTKQILDEYALADNRIKVVYRSRTGHVCAATNTAIELANGAFLALMDHDDMLAPHALYMVAEELDHHPNADLIYTDEDKIDNRNRRYDPYFKTDWNEELFYSQNMIAHLGVYRTSLVREIGGFRVGFEGSQDYDLALRLLRRTDASRIRHIPHILYHWRIYPGVSTLSTNDPSRSIDTARRALERAAEGNRLL